MFIKILSLLVMLVCLSVRAQGQEVILYGDDEYPPYSYVENGMQKGIYTDILRKVDSQLPDYQIVLKAIPWKRGLRMLRRGVIAFLYPPYKRPIERPYMTYSTPMLREELSLFCRRDTQLTPSSRFPEDFTGMLVGENLGFSSGKKIHGARDLGIIKLSSSKGTLANLKRLIYNSLNCYVNDRISILYELHLLQTQDSYDGKSIVETVSLSSEYGHLGVTKKVENFPYIKDFVEKFNHTIKRLEQTGEIKKIADSYIGNINR